MKIISKEVQLNAFSIPGFILPTFQKAKLKTVRGCFNSRSVLRFSYFENEGDSMDMLKEIILRVK